MGKELIEGDIFAVGRMTLGYPFSVLSGDIFDQPASINSQVDTFSIGGIFNREGTVNLARGENQLVNRSHFFGLGDIAQIMGEELGGITINSIHAANALEKTGGGTVYAHSQGTSVMRGSFALLDAGIRGNIIYEGWGGQSFISRGGLYGIESSINVRNPGDFVPFLSPRNLLSHLMGRWCRLPSHGQWGWSPKHHTLPNYTRYRN